MRIKMAAVAVGLVMVAGCKPPAGTGAPGSAWVRVNSAEGRFRADYPVKPVTQSKDLHVGTYTVTLHALSIGRRGGPEFSVMWSDYPAEILALTNGARILQNIRDGYTQGGQNILAESDVRVAGHAGHELEAQTADGAAAFLAEDAGAFAEDIGGADMSAGAAEDVVAEDAPGGIDGPALGDLADEAGDVDAGGAGAGAGCGGAGSAALETGVGFGGGAVLREGGVGVAEGGSELGERGDGGHAPAP